MMENTLREHLKEQFPNGVAEVEHEEIVWAIHDWLSCRGLEWTWDDRKAVEEIGEDPDDYMCFDEDQLSRIDEIYSLVGQLCDLMITPLSGKNGEKEEFMGGHGYEIADDVAELLTRMGYTVYFPIHGETDKGEFFSDVWQ